jgi:hypothetical protein
MSWAARAVRERAVGGGAADHRARATSKDTPALAAIVAMAPTIAKP